MLLTACVFFIFGWLSRGNSKSNDVIRNSVKNYYTKDSVRYVPEKESEIRTNWLTEVAYIDTNTLDQRFVDSVLKAVNGKQLAYVADDYFKKRYYSDTLGDSTYRLVLMDSVWKNEIFWKSHNISVKHTNTTYIKPPRPYISFGVFGGYSKDYQSLGGLLSFTTKNKFSVGYGYSPFGGYHTIYLSKGLSIKK